MKKSEIKKMTKDQLKKNLNKFKKEKKEEVNKK